MIRRMFTAALAAAFLLVAGSVKAQRQGAAELGELVLGLGVNTRVLIIGAHPDDEDTQLIAWLARGRQIETAYLSLTRGDGGQNLIGNELGEALGAIRTEELLSARRIDGGHQYFTRAYDFGFSKTAEETYQHWPKDSILRDVVSVVRDFRPHVIIAIFTGTPRDGHGHHQVSGLLAREAFDLAGDGTRMPAGETHGRAPWTPLKFYRSSRFGGESTYRFDVGEYSPLRGESYAQIAAESRSQHKSQGQGSLQRKGVIMDGLRLEASHLGSIAPGVTETSLFAGIDTTWSRVSHEARRARTAIDSIPPAMAEVQRLYDPYRPEQLLGALSRLARLTSDTAVGDPDADASVAELALRVNRATLLASGIGVDAAVDHETWAIEEPVRAMVTVYNRSALEPLFISRGMGTSETSRVDPLHALQFTDTARVAMISQPWWLRSPRVGDIFGVQIVPAFEEAMRDNMTRIAGTIGGAHFTLDEPLVFRSVDPVKGEIDRPIAMVPAVSVTVDQPIQYVPANRPFERVVMVSLHSASNHARTVRVSLTLPRGLTADSSSITVGLPDYAGNFGGEAEPQGIPGGRPVASTPPVRTVEFHVSGTLAEGRHTILAAAESEGQRYTTGYTLVDYDHIRPQRLFREAKTELSAVDVRVASNLSVGYIPGVGDNVAPMLAQLGVLVTIIEPDKLASMDLSRFTTVVVGPRAYERSTALVAANAKLFDFVRRGHTLVVQYGQFEMASPGMMPYPVTIVRPGDRVTEENAPVSVTDSSSPILNAPNKIGPADWQGWVQERSLYMPRTHDERYRTMLSMNDTGERPNDGAVLIAPLGAGTYVYTTLAFFRQLPAGVPGGARLFVNLLSADQRSAGTPSSAPKP